MEANRRGFNADLWPDASFPIFRKCHTIVTILSHICHNNRVSLTGCFQRNHGSAFAAGNIGKTHHHHLPREKNSFRHDFGLPTALPGGKRQLKDCQRECNGYSPFDLGSIKCPMRLVMKKLLALFAGLAVSAACAGADPLVIKGSETLGAKLVPELAEAYKAEHPDASFSIAAEGSSTGFASLIEQTANIGMASRHAKPLEISAALAKGIDLKGTIVAWDGIAIILNTRNPIQALTRKQVEQIFSGDITDWSAVGGKPGKISLYTRNTASGTYADFKELAMSKRDYAESAQKMAGPEQIVEEVSKNPAGIGCVGLAFIRAPGIRVVAVDGKNPTQANVRNKSYPYSRPTFFYTNGNPAGATRDFIDFTLSTKGQKIVEQVGFVPIQ